MRIMAAAATISELMASGERRGLTVGERALGRSMFGDEVQWRAVRVAQASPLGFGAMVPLGRTIIFSKWRAHRDFARARLEDQGWFVHELAHVWQAERGTFLAAAKLAALGKRAYRYSSAPNAKLAHFNIERQAEIARHLFLARAGAAVEGAPPLAWLEAVWATRSKALPR
ncbi:MAG: hypothetical protein JNM59_02455 [Hyphomonadaceae bacterium]|nr:hypothetical protein [Hyphomonadaceae bacterium]